LPASLSYILYARPVCLIQSSRTSQKRTSKEKKGHFLFSKFLPPPVGRNNNEKKKTKESWHKDENNER
jgi:hypothetical protein